MPLPEGTEYKYKKGTKIRLAFLRGKVIESKNMAHPERVHTRAEFKEDERRRKKSRSMHEAMMR